MFELPLFPLNTVLFPSTPLQLHIFEKRYKRMMNMCIEKDYPFGVVLIKQGVEAHGPLAEPYLIGCTAHIVHVQLLEEGNMNILAMGYERFRILSMDKKSYPYLAGMVEEYPLENLHPEKFRQQAEGLRAQFERFILKLVKASGSEFNLEQLPEDPVTLAYIAAALTQIPAVEKQALLETARADEFVAKVLNIYRREVALLQVVLDRENKGKESTFSTN